MNEYSKYQVLKFTLEDLFGKEAWYDLKESNELSIWKKYGIKTLGAIKISIFDTVKYRGEEWVSEIEELIEQGSQNIKEQKI
ncbi:hypothetical protein ACJJI3_12685 [Microbulbifer sp. ZKSA004]|uniref:hypothetical protein n=1 Tax=Microbulbifer sp. ZKSA004 TaxID=3243389 RepID=UPI00403A2868